jgi:hypothetical protein
MTTKKITLKGYLIRIGLALVLLTVLGVAGWLTFVFNFSYSDGDRTGYVQKVSQKGWVCKTYEGELTQITSPGQPAEKFTFTVRNAKVVEDINRFAGSKVSIHYEHHKGIPTSCFGETEYFITAVRKLD